VGVLLSGNQGYTDQAARSVGSITVQLIDLVKRSSPPTPWAEGDNIPWNDPGFSRRMLEEHLSQAHDAASRRFETIVRQVDWIHSILLSQQPTPILDLGCGPGLYAERLARLGHTITGIDYSPASIEYAIAISRRDQLSCTYICQDIRQVEFPHGMGLVMLIYGEFNIFQPSHAKILLNKAFQALEPGGLLLLEPHTYEAVQQIGEKPASWYSTARGLFSGRPHLVLQENSWDAQLQTATVRYYVIDAPSGQVIRYAQSFQAYQEDEYCALISAYGFGDIKIYPGLSGVGSQKELIAIVAQKEYGSGGQVDS
jgi:SAM-dependent methyltransferase